MSDNVQKQFSLFLTNLSDELDISPTLFEEAKRSYEAVGNWLWKEDSPLFRYNPEIYPQGSFRLGTVVKPITDEDDYDLDLVLEMQVEKDGVTQKELKQMVGDRLESHGTYAGMMKPEGNRCWTLEYANSAKFHMDILPSVPDDETSKSRFRQLGVPAAWARYAICLTDKTRRNYEIIDKDWACSNPKGYAKWFKDRMRVRLDEQKRVVMLKQALASIEEVPDYLVKTPLQRAVQILKRHRNIKFQMDDKNKPISIIITTLAAQSYNNESDLTEALLTIVNGMIRHIGDSEILNPVNPLENFADKWHSHPELQQHFQNWLIDVRDFMEGALSVRGIEKVAGHMQESFGDNVTTRAFVKYGDAMRKERESGILKMGAGTGILGAAGQTVKGHTFYGQ